MDFHTICGLPRSGSTLICNLLNQNPDFYASSTSTLPIIMGAVTHTASNSVEFTSDRINDREKNYERLRRSVHDLICAWYADTDAKVVFDKSRAWPHHIHALTESFPATKTIVIVRDPRSVFASIEKSHLANPLLNAEAGLERTQFQRASRALAPEGVLGSCIIATEDIVRRQVPNAILIKFEEFVEDPEYTMRKVYKALDMKPFDHNYKEVENVAEDIDQLYLDKFPHKGEGEVVPPTSHWSDHISPDVAHLIINQYPYFANYFGYS